MDTINTQGTTLQKRQRRMSKTTGRPPRLQLRLFGRSTHSAFPIPRCFRHRFKNPFPNFGTLSGEPMNRGHPQVFDEALVPFNKDPRGVIKEHGVEA
jgi:hypothetical protein